MGPTTSATLAAGAAVAFIFILGLSAYWDPSIRVLHVFEAAPYAMAAFLCLRRRKWGYQLAVASGLFWLWMAGTRTTFVRNGFEQLSMLVMTGTVARWDVFIAAPAAVSTAALAASALWSYGESPTKAPKDVSGFVVALVAVVAYFAIIFWGFAPQYLRLFPGWQ